MATIHELRAQRRLIYPRNDVQPIQYPNLPPGRVPCNSPPSPEQFPPFREMLKSAASSFTIWALSGFGLTSKDLFQARIAICTECPHRQEYRCLACGCFIHLKARLPEPACPHSYWPQ